MSEGLSIKEVEKVCQGQFNCKIQNRGYGIHKNELRTIAIIVGKKVNIAYDPNSPRAEIRSASKYIPDIRIKHISAGITEEDLIEMVQDIKKSLPEPDMRSLEISDKKDNFSKTFGANEPVKTETPVKKIVDEDDHPADKEKGEDKFDLILGAIGDLSESVNSLGDRVTEIEGKKTIEKKVKSNKSKS